MHGSICLELQKYVQSKHGSATWSALLEKAGLAGVEFELMKEYPDEAAFALVGAASEATGAAPTVILEDFGAFIAPDLLEMFWGTIKPEWKTLDVVEHTEETIHKVVRLKNPGAKPPNLRVTRHAADRLEIDYRSARKLCAVARGIVRGLAAHYKESVRLHEPECMQRGDARCLIEVRLEAPA
jgi:predicted hydrocarbon binding protein